jgi:hypothetical protein
MGSPHSVLVKGLTDSALSMYRQPPRQHQVNAPLPPIAGMH